jgi:hypothetical protein
MTMVRIQKYKRNSDKHKPELERSEVYAIAKEK